MSVRSTIEFFIDRKRSDFLEKEISNEIKNKKDKSTDVIEAARQKHQPTADKKYTLDLWLERAVKDAKPYITTHPSKFTNPKIKNTKPCVFYGESRVDGYVKTGNVKLATKYDVSGNSATNLIIFELYELLDKELDSGGKIINLFESDNADLKQVICSIGLEYQKVRDACLTVYFGDERKSATHELIRQVYFPANDNYHMLSISTASMLMFEVKLRVDAFDKWIDGKHVRSYKNDNVFYEDGFDEVYGITEIGFSHNEFTKMGNVSYLNVKNKGLAYLLQSLPPSLKSEEVRLPTAHFFTDCLWPNQFKASFELLHNWLVDSRNNVQVRTRRDELLLDVFNEIVNKIWQIRATEEGWSLRERFYRLPKAQKIMLDNHWQNERGDDEQYLNVFLKDMARWIILAYKKVLGSHALPLNDDELLHVYKLIDEQKEALL